MPIKKRLNGVLNRGKTRQRLKDKKRQKADSNPDELTSGTDNERRTPIYCRQTFEKNLFTCLYLPTGPFICSLFYVASGIFCKSLIILKGVLGAICNSRHYCDLFCLGKTVSLDVYNLIIKPTIKTFKIAPSSSLRNQVYL